MSNLEVSVDSLIEDLEYSYRWFQIKRHTLQGKRIYTVLIQDKMDVRTFHKGNDENIHKAIRQALSRAKANEEE